MNRLTRAQVFMWTGGRGWPGRFMMIGLMVCAIVIGVLLHLVFGSLIELVWVPVFLLLAPVIIVKLAESAPAWKQRHPSNSGDQNMC